MLDDMEKKRVMPAEYMNMIFQSLLENEWTLEDLAQDIGSNKRKGSMS